MRKSFSALLLCLTISWSAACDERIGFSESGGLQLPAPDGINTDRSNVEQSTKLVDFAGIETVRLELPTARVRVSQTASDETAFIEVTEIILNGGLFNVELERLLEESGITAQRSFVDDSRLDIEATLAEGLADTDIVFDVHLVVPAGASVEILVANGPVEVAALTGNVEIHTLLGEVDIDGVEGNVVVETTEEPVTVLDVTGDVWARTTVSDVTLRLAPPPDGQVYAETTTGDIELTLSKTTAASVRLNSDEGEVSANLSGFQITNISTGSGFLEGVLNGGGGQIEARTTTGEIIFAGM